MLWIISRDLLLNWVENWTK